MDASTSELLGVPAEVHAKGQVWKFGPANQYAKGILEELFAGEAVQQVQKLKQALPPGAYKEAFDGVMRQIAAKDYATGAPGWLSMLQSTHGMLLLALSLFRVNHPNMTAAECEAVMESAGDSVEAAFVRVIPDFFTVAFPKIPRDQLTAMVSGAVNAMQSARRMSATETSTAV